MNVDPNIVFPLLDHELAVYERLYRIVISGGAVIALSYNERRTNDVDVVMGDMNDEMTKAADVVGKQLKLKEGWLNKSAESFNADFGLGWENRLRDVYIGKHLIVSAIHEDDLIRSKYFAFLNRGLDLEDLVFLNPSRITIIKLMKEAISENKIPRPKHDIFLDTNDLLRELGHEELKSNEQ
jgi:hypothetical protein